MIILQFIGTESMCGLLAKSRAHLVLWTISSSRFPRWLIYTSGSNADLHRTVALRLSDAFDMIPRSPWSKQTTELLEPHRDTWTGEKHAGSDCPLVCLYQHWTTTWSRWRRQSWWVVCKSIQYLKQVLHLKWEKGGAFHRLRTDTFRYLWIQKYLDTFSNTNYKFYYNLYIYIRYSCTLTNDAMFVVYQDSEISCSVFMSSVEVIKVKKGCDKIKQSTCIKTFTYFLIRSYCSKKSAELEMITH